MQKIVLNKYPDLRLLAQFVMVCDAPSLSAAARSLGVTTAAVSQAMLRLEQEFGVQLLDRHSQGLRMTPAGAVLRDHAWRLLGEADEMVASLASYQKHTLPHLRLHVIESVARYIVPTLITSLEGAAGELTVQSGRNATYIEDLLRGSLDVVIASEDLCEVPSLESIPLCSERVIALMPSTRAPKDGRIETLASLPLLRISRVRRLDRMLSELMVEYGLEPTRTVECSSIAAVLDLIGQGYGWTVSTPLSVAHLLPDTEGVAWMPLPDESYCRSLYLIAAKNRLLDLPDFLADRCRRAFETELGRWTDGFEADARKLVPVARISAAKSKKLSSAFENRK